MIHARLNGNAALSAGFAEPFADFPDAAGTDAGVVGAVRPGLLNHDFRLRRMFFHVIVNVSREGLHGFRAPAEVARLLNRNDVPRFPREDFAHFRGVVLIHPVDVVSFLVRDVVPVAVQFASAVVCAFKKEFASGGFHNLLPEGRKTVRKTVSDGKDFQILLHCAGSSAAGDFHDVNGSEYLV